MLRRVQRAFRAHVRTQAEEAEAALHATRAAGGSLCDGAGGIANSFAGSAQYARLCDILRRCSLEGVHANLSRDDQSVLVTLQQAVRSQLESKKRQGHPASGWADRMGPHEGIQVQPSGGVTGGGPHSGGPHSGGKQHAGPHPPRVGLPTVPSVSAMEGMADEEDAEMAHA